MNKPDNKIKMLPELFGMKGGDKYMWLNNHRREVLEYAAQNGKEAALKRFNMVEGTWQRFNSRQLKDNVLKRASKPDLFFYHEVMEEVRNDRCRISDLEQWRKQLESIINFCKALMVIYNFQPLQAQSKKMLAMQQASLTRQLVQESKDLDSQGA